jgi:cytochrome c oxidase subunit 3
MPRSEQVLELETNAAEGPHAVRDASFTGMLALIAAITMLFAAFSSAYIVRRGMSSDWTPLRPSAQLWISATMLLLGSTILEWGRRSGARRVYVAIVAAFGIIAGLIIVQGWRELVQTGASAAASPAVAFFYIFSGAFLLCLISGIVAILRAAARGSTMTSTALYWHYVTGLWLWVLTLLIVWP